MLIIAMLHDGSIRVTAVVDQVDLARQLPLLAQCRIWAVIPHPGSQVTPQVAHSLLVELERGYASKPWTP